MALPEELDQRLEERLSLVETPDYEGEQMTRQDYVSVLLLCALVAVSLNAFFNGVSGKTAEADAASAAASATH